MFGQGPCGVVGEIMTRDPVTIGPSNCIRKAIALMREGGFRRLPVVEGGRLVGIVTDRDLRRAANSPLVVRERWYDNFLMDHIQVGACMTANPITVSPQTLIVEAACLLRDHKIGGLPVVEGGRLVGIVTETDLLNYLIDLLQGKRPLPVVPRPEWAT
jgi:acetoin utilization protein AcuB